MSLNSKVFNNSATPITVTHYGHTHELQVGENFRITDNFPVKIAAVHNNAYASAAALLPYGLTAQQLLDAVLVALADVDLELAVEGGVIVNNRP